MESTQSTRYLEEQAHRQKVQSRLRALEVRSRSNELGSSSRPDPELSNPLPGEVSLVWDARQLSCAILAGASTALIFYAIRHELPHPSKSLESIEGWLWLAGLVIGLFAIPMRSAFCNLRISAPKPEYYIASRHAAIRALLNILLLVLSAFIGWILSSVFVLLAARLMLGVK
ncbi:MAG: hypothetical protein KGL40_08505 [Rhodocyclaceae bacterium]|nr:hypothetical protein [Rhodocyclaceae bacterium]